MQEHGFVSFIAILFKLWKKINVHILEKFHDQCILNFANKIAQKEIAFSSFFLKREKKSLKKYQNTAITFHVENFSAKYDNYWEKKYFF